MGRVEAPEKGFTKPIKPNLMTWIEKVLNLFKGAKNTKALLEMEKNGVSISDLKARQKKLDGEEALHISRGVKYNPSRHIKANREFGEICREALERLPK